MSCATTFTIPEPGGAAPAPARKPPKQRASAGHLGLALALTALALAAWQVSAPTAAPQSPAAAQPGPIVAAASADATAAPPPIAPAQATPAAALAIARDAGLLVIHARAASREQAARQLAALTDSELIAPAEAFEGAAPLTLHWQGRNVEQAWREVLGPASAHALQCDGPRCRVWLLANGAPPQRADTAGPQAATHATLQPDPPGLFPAE